MTRSESGDSYLNNCVSSQHDTDTRHGHTHTSTQPQDNGGLYWPLTPTMQHYTSPHTTPLVDV